jgi:hypothetical protein
MITFPEWRRPAGTGHHPHLRRRRRQAPPATTGFDEICNLEFQISLQVTACYR